MPCFVRKDEYFCGLSIISLNGRSIYRRHSGDRSSLVSATVAAGAVISFEFYREEIFCSLIQTADWRLKHSLL